MIGQDPLAWAWFMEKDAPALYNIPQGLIDLKRERVMEIARQIRELRKVGKIEEAQVLGDEGEAIKGQISDIFTWRMRKVLDLARDSPHVSIKDHDLLSWEKVIYHNLVAILDEYRREGGIEE